MSVCVCVCVCVCVGAVAKMVFVPATADTKTMVATTPAKAATTAWGRRAWADFDVEPDVPLWSKDGV